MLLFTCVTVICRSDILGMLGCDGEKGADEDDFEWNSWNFKCSIWRSLTAV